MPISNRGENNPMFGKKHSEETKRKIAEKITRKPPKSKEWFYIKYHIEELSLNKISVILGVGHEMVSRWLVRYEIPKRNKKHAHLISIKGIKQSEEHVKKRFESMKDYRGQKHHAWKNGKTKTNEGYIYEKAYGHPHANANGCVLEHRLVMERKFNRYLSLDEIVHHINEVKGDNRLENLFLFATQRDHNYFHTMKRRNKNFEMRYQYESYCISG